MRRFSYLSICASLVAALVPAALPAQTITFAQPHAFSVNTPVAANVDLYAHGNYLGKSINHLIVRYDAGSYQYPDGFVVGDGTGDFPEVSSVSLPTATVALTADINGDGKADLITLLPACIAAPCFDNDDVLQGNVTFMVSNGDESFTNVGSVQLPVGLSGLQAVIGDFNKDGKPDIAIVGYATRGTGGNAQLIILLNRGDASFSKKSYLLPSTLFTQATVSNLVTGDFDGDGNPDLAFAFYGGAVGKPWIYTFAGDGKGNFGPARRAYILDSNFVANGHPLQAADLNGDGRTDLVINLTAKSSAGSPRIASLLSKGSAGFYWASAVSIAEPGATDIVVADFNGDGKPDLAYIGQTQFTTPIFEVGGVFTGNGKGAFLGPQLSLLPSPQSGEEIIQGSPTGTLTSMPFHNGQLPSLLISLGNSSELWELNNTTK